LTNINKQHGTAGMADALSLEPYQQHKHNTPILLMSWLSQYHFRNMDGLCAVLYQAATLTATIQLLLWQGCWFRPHWTELAV